MTVLPRPPRFSPLLLTLHGLAAMACISGSVENSSEQMVVRGGQEAMAPRREEAKERPQDAGKNRVRGEETPGKSQPPASMPPSKPPVEGRNAELPRGEDPSPAEVPAPAQASTGQPTPEPESSSTSALPSEPPLDSPAIAPTPQPVAPSAAPQPDAPSPPPTCISTVHAVEFPPKDLYIMLDQSVSMTKGLINSEVTRWEGVTAALRAFVQDPRAQGTHIGLQYFGLTVEEDCDARKYANPDVAIGPIPAVNDAIAESLDRAAGPSTFTPTYPALQGALSYAQEHVLQHPQRATAVVLLTDGFPFTAGVGDCNDSIGDCAELAAQAARAPLPVYTYLIGVSAGFDDMTSISREGQGSAYLVEEGDITEQVLEALISVVTKPRGCRFEVPPPEESGGGVPRVQLTLNGQEQGILLVPSQDQCDQLSAEERGWYYDTTTNPTALVLCEETCRAAAAEGVTIETGCPL